VHVQFCTLFVVVILRVILACLHSRTDVWARDITAGDQLILGKQTMYRNVE